MKAIFMAALLVLWSASEVLAWGQEGHSIIAEVAQQRLSPDAAKGVRDLVGPRSLASVASWADNIRDERPETYNWHFVDIPINVPTFKQERDCKENKLQGDCVLAALDRLRVDLRCGTPDMKRTEALKFIVTSSAISISPCTQWTS